MNAFRPLLSLLLCLLRCRPTGYRDEGLPIPAEGSLDMENIARSDDLQRDLSGLARVWDLSTHQPPLHALAGIGFP
ncbi:hypothetical protein EDB85DRAFT_1977202 [Lactarius pseudohatsudake]|nr:hypothetical protein EDB85DRAFT_1977202 [Lactarius pseudohatsudake]